MSEHLSYSHRLRRRLRWPSSLPRRAAPAVLSVAGVKKEKVSRGHDPLGRTVIVVSQLVDLGNQWKCVLNALKLEYTFP